MRGYTGLFLFRFNGMKSKLENDVKNKHITLSFGEIEEFPKEIEGRWFNVLVTGYGINGNNEGYRVELPEPLRPYFKGKVPHITIGLSEGARAVDTAELEFYDIEPFYIKARVGYFLFTPDKKGATVFDLEAYNRRWLENTYYLATTVIKTTGSSCDAREQGQLRNECIFRTFKSAKEYINNCLKDALEEGNCKIDDWGAKEVDENKDVFVKYNDGEINRYFITEIPMSRN